MTGRKKKTLQSLIQSYFKADVRENDVSENKQAASVFRILLWTTGRKKLLSLILMQPY